MLERSLQTIIRNLCFKGEGFLQQGKFAEALNVFEQARNYCANVPSIHILIADVLMRMRRFKEAIDILNHAQELFELDSQEVIWESESDLLRRARKAYFNPDGLIGVDTLDSWKNPKICYSLAICWKKIGNIEKGWGFLKKAAMVVYVEFENSPGPHQELSSLIGAPLDSLGNVLNEVGVFETAGMYADAFNLLSPLVYDRIVANDKAKSKAAGR